MSDPTEKLIPYRQFNISFCQYMFLIMLHLFYFVTCVCIYIVYGEDGEVGIFVALQFQ